MGFWVINSRISAVELASKMHMNESSVMESLTFSPDIDLGLIINQNGEMITINHYDLEPGTTYTITFSEQS